VVSLASLRGETANDLELRSLSGEELRRVLGRSAEVVKQFGDILRGAFRRFDEAIAERRAHIARLEADYQRELADEETRSMRRALHTLVRATSSLIGGPMSAHLSPPESSHPA
jgi:hypothetical protein